MLANSRIFWNVRAMPAREITSGVRRARLQTAHVPAPPMAMPAASAIQALRRRTAGSRSSWA